MGQYVAHGPIRDAPNPFATFPVVDVFSPSGQLVYHAASINQAKLFIERYSVQQAAVFNFPTDNLNDIATRFPELHLHLDSLKGNLTLLFVSATGCHACELQDKPLEDAHFNERGINQISVTLTL
jgi:hypothetical protein